MAGFGFSPSDIIEFGKFAHRVRIALRDEGGSTFEYQAAMKQCDEFGAMMGKIKGLGTSSAMSSFDDDLAEDAATTVKFIQEFKRKIKIYDKSLSENATKGWWHGSARKIQWAFCAAKDLAKFT